MSHMWPLNTTTRSPSPTSPIFRPSSPSLSCPVELESASPTGYGPKVIEPEDLEPRRIELDRNLGTDPYQILERILGDHYQNPVTEDMEEFGKVGAEMSYLVPQATGTRTVFARDDKQNRDTIPMSTFAGRPSTMSSLIPVDIRQNSVVGQQRQEISELQSDKFPTPESSWFGRYDSKIKSLPVLIFRRMQCYGSQNWRWLIHGRS